VRRSACTFVLLVLALACVTPARGAVPVSADTSRTAPADSARLTRVAPAVPASADSSVADSIGAVAPRDSSVSFTTRAKPAKKGAKPVEPPYRIEADHMSGGRGPQGDVLFLEKVTITRSGTRLNSQHGSYERSTGIVHLNGDVRVRDPGPAFVRFQMAAIEALPSGLEMWVATPASAGRVGIAGKNRRVPVEGVAAA